MELLVNSGEIDEGVSWLLTCGRLLSTSKIVSSDTTFTEGEEVVEVDVDEDDDVEEIWGFISPLQDEQGGRAASVINSYFDRNSHAICVVSTDEFEFL